MPRQTKLSDLKQDLAQYTRLLQTAQRPRVKQILIKQITVLNSEIQKIHKQIELEKNKSQQTTEQVKQIKPTTNTQQQSQSIEQKPKLSSNIIYTALTKYSWQDQSKKVKIYFTLDNIGQQCTADMIDIQFKPHSVELKIRNYRKQNLLFSIKKTYGEIIPEQCKYLVKTNLLSITLTKKSSNTWTQLNWKEDKFATKQKEDVSGDPNASIMGMMKKMYEQGDQTMKKTIAEAWTKSKDKKDENSFKFD